MAVADHFVEASFSSVSAALRHRDKSHISVTPTYGISVEFDRSCKNVTKFPVGESAVLV